MIQEQMTERDFAGGIRGIEELEKTVMNGMKIAFSMYPTTIEDLMDIADARVMPSYLNLPGFQPKLRSGLFIHKLT